MIINHDIYNSVPITKSSEKLITLFLLLLFFVRDLCSVNPNRWFDLLVEMQPNTFHKRPTSKNHHNDSYQIIRELS